MSIQDANGGHPNGLGLGFIVTTRAAGSDAVEISAAGELDLHYGNVLRDVVEMCCRRDGVSKLVVDLGDVTFIDNSGLEVLEEARKRAATDGKTLVLSRPSKAVMQLFDMTQSVGDFTFAVHSDP